MGLFFCGRSKPLPYGEWDSIVISIEGTRGLKYLPNFMGTRGKVFAKLFSKSGKKVEEVLYKREKMCIMI